MLQGLLAGQAPRRLRGLLAIFALGCAALLAVAPSALANVLRVGTFNGKPGGYHTIQQAVAAAHAGDWVLIGPGDYKEAGVTNPAGGRGTGGAVLVEKAGVLSRGLGPHRIILNAPTSRAP